MTLPIHCGTNNEARVHQVRAKVCRQFDCEIGELTKGDYVHCLLLQLAASILGLHLGATVTETYLTSLLDLDLESDVFPSLAVLVSSPPDLSDGSITRLDRRSKTGSILFDTCWVSATNELHEGVC